MKTGAVTVQQTGAGTRLAEKALLLRTLGHPVRLEIAAGLASRCSCVKEIWECLKLPQAVVSQHLKVMKETGIIEGRREGNRVCYSLKNDVRELVLLLQRIRPAV